MVDATPLTNADFRKLLATPRREAPTPGGSKGPAKTPARNNPNKPKKPYTKPKPGTEAEEDEDSKYRDRAEERRRGVNPDYANTTQLLSVLGPSGDVDPSKLSVADSKYLGGDLEHTHLVKGLDYALLNKMRSTMEKDGSQAGDDEEGPAGDKEAGGQAKTAPKREELIITHPVAKGVYGALFERAAARTRVAESFLPRRTAFVYCFEADDDGVVQDIPTTLRRSKTDCPKPPDAVFAKVDTAVIGRIAKIMSYIKTGAGGKKVRKKERDELLGELMGGDGTAAKPIGGGQAAAAAGKAAGAMPPPKAPPPKAPAELDDIFEDAGTDYTPSVTGKKKAAPAAAAAAGGGGEDMEIEEGEMMLPPPPPVQGVQGPAPGHHDTSMYGQQWPNAEGDGYAGPHEVQAAHSMAGQVAGAGPEAGAQQQEGGDVPKWRVRTKKASEREVDYVDDAYGEYYPMAGGFDVPALDDEDEGDADPTRKTAKPEEKGKTGVAKEAAREDAAKVNSQLQKIENLFKEKGFDHSGAFGRTPSRKTGTGEDPNLVLKQKKRQRI